MRFVADGLFLFVSETINWMTAVKTANSLKRGGKQSKGTSNSSYSVIRLDEREEECNSPAAPQP